MFYVLIISIYLINIIKFKLYLQNSNSFLKENYFPDLPQTETAETHVSTSHNKESMALTDDEILSEKIVK